MSSPSTTSVRRRIALATGAGALVLLGGGGVAYAASSIDDSVETGWSTVVDADPASTGDTAQARDQQDCPDLSDQSQTDQSQTDQSQADQSQDPSQDGEL
jgi:hypothetical protein